MATLCKNCGIPLRDDAKFCNNCGTLAPSHPFSSRTESSSNNVKPTDGGRSDTTRPAMREQIAYLPQSPLRPVRRVAQDEPPTWMSRLDDDRTQRIRPRTMSHTDEADSVPQLDFPVPEPLPRPNSSQRELRVKVWQQEEPVSSPGLPRQDFDRALSDGMDALPTSPLSSPQSPVRRNGTASMSTRLDYTSRVDELERMDTAHLAAPAQVPASQRSGQPAPGRSQQPFAFEEQPTSSLARRGVQAESRRDEATFSRQNYAAQAAQSNAPLPRTTQSQPLNPASLSYKPVVAPQRKQGRKPLVFVVGLLAIVLLGGIGVWVGIFHPFSIPEIVQTQQSFSNGGLGFSLQYPTGWNTRVDSQASSVYFADSSSTAQFTVTGTPANGKDAGQYLQQLSGQLKMTNIKSGEPLTFGGATWQQIQGNVLYTGANYSESILATVRNNRMYTITQAAPQSTYMEEEQIVFSTIRASFKFI